jgi:hypothetical protein
MNEEDATMRTAIAPLEEIAERQGLDPKTLREAVDAGEIRAHRRPGDPRTFLAEREVLVWMGGRSLF